MIGNFEDQFGRKTEQMQCGDSERKRAIKDGVRQLERANVMWLKVMADLNKKLWRETEKIRS